MSHNILILGNGFDRAMKRKTSYSDFFEFVKSDKEISTFKHWIESHKIESRSRINKILENNSNLYIDFIESCKIGDDPKWFEIENKISEIASALQEISTNLDRYKSIFDIRLLSVNVSKTVNKVSTSIQVNKRAIDFILKQIGKEFLESKSDPAVVIAKIKDKFAESLEQLTEFLELYLSYLDYMDFENQKIPIQNTALSAIENIKTVDVITFNYTDTALNLFDIPLEKIHYIHGRIDLSKEVNKMVFGIEDKSDLNDTDLIPYKKYYQRIVKETGDLYEQFFTPKRDMNKPLDGLVEKNIIVFGHSVDPLDKEVFKKCFDLSEGGQYQYRFFFAFFDESAKRSIVKNLIIILGKDKVIQLTSQKKIVFLRSTDVEYLREMLL